MSVVDSLKKDGVNELVADVAALTYPERVDFLLWAMDDALRSIPPRYSLQPADREGLLDAARSLSVEMKEIVQKPNWLERVPESTVERVEELVSKYSPDLETGAGAVGSEAYPWRSALGHVVSSLPPILLGDPRVSAGVIENLVYVERVRAGAVSTRLLEAPVAEIILGCGAGAVVTERVDYERSLEHVIRKVGLMRGQLPGAKET